MLYFVKDTMTDSFVQFAIDRSFQQNKQLLLFLFVDSSH